MGRYDQEIKKEKSLLPIVIAIILLIGFAIWMFFNQSEKQEHSVDLKIESISLPKVSPVTNPDEKETPETGDNVTDIRAIRSQQIIEPEQELQEAIVTRQQQHLLPALENSDHSFKDEIFLVSTDLSSWFETQDVIKKYIILINDISQKQILSKHKRFLNPLGDLTVEKNSQGLFLTETSYKRYDGLAKAISSIDVNQAINVYRTFRPLFNTVFKEFSYPVEYSLEYIFLKAAKNVINAPVIEDKIKLVRRSVLYTFADKKLESLNNVEKQMIRMGPENTRKIQATIRKLAQVLSKEASDLKLND